VSFLGAALIIFITYTLGHWDKSFYIISFDDAMGAIDLNVIFLLMGMMIFVGVMKKTGPEATSLCWRSSSRSSPR
jgi:Na+/H+ antiporter NhaD/arsenite permease-like protein